MQDRDFVWDDTKAASNWLDHGITFETARAAFDDALSDDTCRTMPALPLNKAMTAFESSKYFT